MNVSDLIGIAGAVKTWVPRRVGVGPGAFARGLALYVICEFAVRDVLQDISPLLYISHVRII